MRLIAVLLVAGLFATAGCFGKDDENGDATTPTPTPTGGTGTPTPTGATPTATPTTTPTPTAPTVLPPRELCTVSYNFGSPPPVPPAPVAPTSCGTLAAGYKKLTLAGNFTSQAPATPIPQELKIDLLDPTGAVAATCSLPTPAMQATAVPCAPKDTTSAAAGEWKIQPTGTAAVQFTGNVVAS